MKDRPKGATQEAIRYWFARLLPLLEDVAQDGSPNETFDIFFALHDGDYNDLVGTEQMLDLVCSFCDRLEKGYAEGSLELDRIDHDGGQRMTFRHVAVYAAQTVDSLRRSGLLRGDHLKECAYRLLLRFSTQQISDAKAVQWMLALQNEM